MTCRRVLFRLALFGLLFGCGEGAFHTSFGQENGPDGADAGDAGALDASRDGGDAGAPDATTSSGLPHGSPCSSDDACAGDRCLQGGTWAGGYCTEPCLECAQEGSSCVRPELSTINICAADCRTHDDCRDGYVCKTDGFSDDTVCLPGVRGNPDGGACESDADCAGGTCITDWPGGYCTTAHCNTFEDCDRGADDSVDNRCLQNPSGANLCVRMCETSEVCREGYICETLGGGEGFCAPDPSRPFNPETFEGLPFEVVCQPSVDGSARLAFEVGAGVSSYLITPLIKDGTELAPRSITRPSGEVIDFGGANWFQAISAQLYGGGMNPTIVPATAQHAAQLEAGTHDYLVETSASEACYYVLSEEAPGDTIDFNIYFVDVPGLSAEFAPSNASMQVVLDTFDLIFGSVGYGIGQVRYFDITGDDAAAFGVIQSQGDVADLVTLSQRPGQTYDDVLSVNIFFVRSFAMGGAIGISMGLPGPAGLHGTHGSGVAFTAEYLGTETESPTGGTVSGDVLTAQVLAHELGHYLGLFHTSESNGANHDPLPDTPECQQIGLDCPDLTNLMFPYAGTDHTTLTADQAYVVGVNPLTKVPGATPVEPTGPDAGTTDPDAGVVGSDAGTVSPDAGVSP